MSILLAHHTLMVKALSISSSAKSWRNLENLDQKTRRNSKELETGCTDKPLIFKH
jgi:hypothetical protein